MNNRIKSFFRSADMCGMLMSLSGILLGVLLAVADYRVDWKPAVALILTVVPIHMYMTLSGRLWLLSSVALACLTAWLSYGTLLSMESLILLFFGYFIIRLARGFEGRGRLSDGIMTCILKGPVALFGAYFVCTHAFPYWIFILPALSVGLLSSAADGCSDGYRKGGLVLLILAGLILMTAFSYLRVFSPVHYLYILTVPFYLVQFVRMYKNKEQHQDVCRPVLALLTFAAALLDGVGFIGFLF
jgi:hypothetical protein